MKVVLVVSILLSGLLVACGDSGPEPGFDVTGRWREQDGLSTLELTDDGNYRITFDPPLSDGSHRFDGNSYNRIDDGHLTFFVVLGRESLETIEVEASINSKHVLEFRLDGNAYRMVRLETGEAWTRPADRMTMVYVPAGEFEMGSTQEEVEDALALCSAFRSSCGFENEQPRHTVALDDFWIDLTEVTNAQYRACVQAGRCSPPVVSGSFDTQPDYYGDSSFDDHPVVRVSWEDATAYCRWAGARLPTEAEWECAARGPAGSLFPWGDVLDGTRANFCDANCDKEWANEAVDDGYAVSAPAGSFPAGASWVGALDMAGNVWEWVKDWYGEYPSERQENPSGPKSGRAQVVRGGAWDYDASNARAAYRTLIPAIRWYDVGFRCARSPE